MISASDPRIADALRHCRSVTRREARNFYYGLKLLPEPKRSALYAVYAWMRAADDLVDHPRSNDVGVDELRRDIESFRARTLAALESREPSSEPILAALQFAARRFRVDPRHLHDMLDGQLDDLRPRRLETFRELELYCRRVASSVGLICIEVWGYRDPCARDLAVDCGIAFQLTNILRDVREDLVAGRVYLPAEDFDRHALTPESLVDESAPTDVARAFLLEQIDRAQRHYDRSAPLIDLLSADARPTLWAMRHIYHGLLEQMRTDPGRIIRGPRPRLGLARKAAIALRARAVIGVAPPASARKENSGAPA